MGEKSGQKVAEPLEINLKNPGWAALLAWLWPGAGHLYQGRRAKGILFMVCILSTYIAGLMMGRGHVVYAAFSPEDRRWQYICQLGVGLPALPALLQSYRVLKLHKEPLGGDIMAPPSPVIPNGQDQLAEWHYSYHQYFELGTLYTMIAGLLNILAIFDAYGGPFVPSSETRKGDSKKAQAADDSANRAQTG
jgi:hypothetical protein